MPARGAPVAPGGARSGGAAAVFLFKLHDGAGLIHRVHADPAIGWDALRERLEARVGPSHPPLAALTFVDDDGDQATVSCDDSLLEAVQQSRRAAPAAPRLVLTVPPSGTVLSPPARASRRRSSGTPEAKELSAVSSFLGGLHREE